MEPEKPKKATRRTTAKKKVQQEEELKDTKSTETATPSRDEFAEELKSTELNLMAKKMFKSNIKRSNTKAVNDEESAGLFEKEFNFRQASEAADETLKEKKERQRQEKI